MTHEEAAVTIAKNRKNAKEVYGYLKIVETTQNGI